MFIRESLDAAEFVMELEQRFGVSIPDRTAAVFTRESVTVADLAAELACAAGADGSRSGGGR